MERTISFTLNGKPTRVAVDDEGMLAWVLRYGLSLTRTKYGCGEAPCGACTVVVNNEAVRSCVTPMRNAAGKSLLTIEGPEQGGELHPIQQAFLKHEAFQRGYCASCMILSAYALLQKTQRPDRGGDPIGREESSCVTALYTQSRKRSQRSLPGYWYRSSFS